MSNGLISILLGILGVAWGMYGVYLNAERFKNVNNLPEEFLEKFDGKINYINKLKKNTKNILYGLIFNVPTLVFFINLYFVVFSLISIFITSFIVQGLFSEMEEFHVEKEDYDELTEFNKKLLEEKKSIEEKQSQRFKKSAAEDLEDRLKED